MRHIIIADLHGRDIWKQVDFDKYQKAVFLGDYVDSYRLSDEVILANLKEIIKLKKKHSEKVVLLWGNHDVQYLHYPKYFCPGFRPSMQRDLTFLFRTNRHLFRMAYQSRNTIFTHAGITNTWWRKFLKSTAAAKAMTIRSSIANLINAVELSEYRDVLYTTSRYRTGQDEDAGILWADYMDTFNDALNGYHQFVGHSAMNEIKLLSWHGKSITYLDVLHRQAYFHEVHC